MNGHAFTRYGRFWAVYDSAGGLVCVTVYKKGAIEVVRRLSPPDHSGQPPPQQASARQGPAGLPPSSKARRVSRGYDPYQ